MFCILAMGISEEDSFGIILMSQQTCSALKAHLVLAVLTFYGPHSHWCAQELCLLQLIPLNLRAFPQLFRAGTRGRSLFSKLVDSECISLVTTCSNLSGRITTQKICLLGRRTYIIVQHDTCVWVNASTNG